MLDRRSLQLLFDLRIPVRSRRGVCQLLYTKSVANYLKKAGFRVDIDRSSEGFGKQIRNTELEKIPVVIVVGKKEVAEQTLSVQTRKKGDIGTLTMPDLQN
jgi:threonyl-tRNA synthetase